MIGSLAGRQSNVRFSLLGQISPNFHAEFDKHEGNLVLTRVRAGERIRRREPDRTSYGKCAVTFWAWFMEG